MVIGLTGGIATGKSTVADMLKEMGAVIIDADLIAREVVEPDEPTLGLIVQRFGSDLLDNQGRLIRSKLGQIISENGQARRDLNQIIHPAIRERMNQQKAVAQKNGEELIILDIPLLFESHLENMMDRILVVYVPADMQRQRLMDRDQINAYEAQKKMDMQWSIEEKKERGHAYIDNSGSVNNTRKQLEQIISCWKAEEAY